MHSLVPHPDYDADTLDNDFAIIKLTKAVKFSQFANAACLPQDVTELFVNKNMIVSGWGNLAATWQNEEYPNWLQVSNVFPVFQFFIIPYFF